MDRHLALVLNSALPGSGLLLRHPGLWPALPVVAGAAGLSLVAVALATPGTASTVLVGWCGLALWLAALLVATIAWMVVERPSSRDLGAIQPLFREIAKAYLTNDLVTAEATARRLVTLAGAEPGAWRLLALVTRARGAPPRPPNWSAARPAWISHGPRVLASGDGDLHSSPAQSPLARTRGWGTAPPQKG